MSQDLYKDKQRKWRWRRVAENGEVISTGESHGTKWAARRAARRANKDIGTRQFIEVE